MFGLRTIQSVNFERTLMDIDRVKAYWLKSAAEDRLVAGHLLEKRDYRYALFLGHLYLEKLLKALVVQETAEQAPYSHNLLFLANKAGIELSEDDQELFDRMTRWSIDARYPDGETEEVDGEMCREELNQVFARGIWLQDKMK